MVLSRKFKPKKRFRKPKLEELNPQQQAFVNHLLASRTFNMSEAARAAGYKKVDTAVTRLSNNPLVKSALQHEMALRQERTQMAGDRIVLELGRIALFNPKLIHDANGNVLPIQKWPDAVAACVASMDIETEESEEGIRTTIRKVRFHDKNKAAELLLKHLGMADGSRKGSGAGSEAGASEMLLHLRNVMEDNNPIVVKALEDQS